MTEVYKLIAASWSLLVLGAAGGVGLSQLNEYDFTDYFVVSDVLIHDSKYGEDPKMTVVRHVHKEFTGEWTVELNSENGVHICAASGKAQYTPGDALPDPLHLFGWWMYGWDCVTSPIPPGCYFADSSWTVTSYGPINQTTRKRSNVFCVE